MAHVVLGSSFRRLESVSRSPSEVTIAGWRVTEVPFIRPAQLSSVTKPKTLISRPQEPTVNCESSFQMAAVTITEPRVRRVGRLIAVEY
jgi:hypothetical protein